MLYWILCLFYFDETNTESELAMGIIKGLRIGLKMLDGILIPYHREEALKFPNDSETKESNDFGSLLYNISI